MTRRRTPLTVLVLAVLLAAGAAACEPPPPLPTFTTNGTAAGADADPGDGTCATAVGACTFEAAVDEANALGRARIVVADPSSSTERLPIDVTLTGQVEVVPANEILGTRVDAHITVAEGASLNSRHTSYATLTVHGGAVVQDAHLGPGTQEEAEQGRTVVVVSETGEAVLRDVLVFGWLADTVDNAGVVALQGVTIAPSNRDRTPDAAPAITTRPTGTTTLAATAFLGDGGVMVDACGGLPPLSLGYNVAYDSTCDLDGPGDLQDVGVHGSGRNVDPILIDRIPLGVLGCGTSWTTQIERFIRPFDGDGDGVDACDTGAWEAVPQTW